MFAVSTDTENDCESNTKFTTLMRRKIRPNMLATNHLYCSLCKNIFDDGYCTLLPCNHGFHNQCINKYVKKYVCCPQCGEKQTDRVPSIQEIKQQYPIDYLKWRIQDLGIVKKKDELPTDDNELIMLMRNYLANIQKSKILIKSLVRSSSMDSITFHAEMGESV